MSVVRGETGRERLVALRALARGVAHDLNNVLLPIVVNADLLLADAPDQLAARLEEIRASARAGKALARGLASFGQDREPRRVRVDLNAMVLDSVDDLRSLLPPSVHLSLSLADAPVVALADASEVRRLLAGLVENAADAIGPSGRIEIGTGRRRAHGEGDGPELGYLSIADDGEGIAPENHLLVFEPFFTTRTGRAGLGLTTVLAVIDRHEGLIELDSEPGRGTRLAVGLPLADSGNPEPEAATVDPTGRDVTVLVVEDDDAVRRLTARVLDSAGYRVLTASDGAEALEIVEAHPGRIDAVVSDMVMPRMTGIELRERLAELALTSPVLFVSGYSWSALERHGVDPESVPILRKPFTRRALLDALGELLAESPS